MKDSPEKKMSAPVETGISENTETPEDMAAAAFTILFKKVFERAADFHKYVLDLYAGHTSDMISAWKRLLPSAPVPGEALFCDFARQGIGHFVEMQKGVVDLVVRQSMIGIGAMREIRSTVSQAAEKGYEPMFDAMDVLISNQESIIGMASSTVERFGDLISDAAEYGVGVRREESSDIVALQHNEIAPPMQPGVKAPVIGASSRGPVNSLPVRRSNQVKRANGAKQKKS
jgi:hypothetical protein